MAYRYWKGLPLAKPKKHKYKSSGNNSKARAEEILKLIRSRQQHNIWHGFPEREPVSNRPLDNDNWQIFKKNFVDLYGGEKVKETGMTDSEFFDWFKTGKTELDKVEESKLKRLLDELHSEEDN